MAIDIQGMKQAKCENWNLGLCGGDTEGDMREYWGLRPQYWLIEAPQSSLEIPRFQCAPLACFNAEYLYIYIYIVWKCR